ncbi:uridine diphosphate glucose pyrophosphatase NUDT22-like [Oreochromis aureus]|uniref:uridine diphosphate glucose pyrophosphatase NUDT22-like n=1 Tax=Oreochromis aureus TaxID=47969 RepID=UPI001952AE5E|nr:uridine diphosphate glucose pyrophosphatase NUDT22-like [Oreochromis aureus]
MLPVKSHSGEIMDPEVSVLLHCAHWQGLLRSQVQVELSERFNRQTDLALERHIDEVWMKRVSKEPWLFNRAKFRLHSFCLADLQNPPSTPLSHGTIFHHTEDQNSQGQRHLGDIHNRCISQIKKCPGYTCYKDYLGTNWSCGEAEFGDPLTLLAQPLGVGGILCTSNGQVVMIRSQKVAEAGGLLDISGGHPERDMNKEDSVNIPLSSLGPPDLMGIALNHTSAGGPSAEFYVR